MATIDEMKLTLVPEYQEKFEAFEKIAFELHKLGEKEIEMQVIKKMAGLKMMIDHCNNIINIKFRT